MAVLRKNRIMGSTGVIERIAAGALPQYSDLTAEKTLNPKVSPKYSLKLG